MTYVILSRAKYLKPIVFNFTPLPSPPPWGGNNDLRHTEQSEVSQSVLVLLNPSPYPSPQGGGNLKFSYSPRGEGTKE